MTANVGTVRPRLPRDVTRNAAVRPILAHAMPSTTPVTAASASAVTDSFTWPQKAGSTRSRFSR